MKTVLTAINAKYIHSNLAVYSLSAYAKKYQYDVTVCEYTINQTVDHVIQSIYKEQPELLCFSCYIWNIMFVEQVIEEIHKLLPEVPIWVGGPEVTYEVEGFLRRHPQVSGVMIGEGENTFVHLLDAYKQCEKKNELDLNGILGIGYLSDDMYMETKPELPVNMDDIPFPYHNMKDFANRIIYYESSRGCPFRCSYCLSSIEKSLRFRSSELVKKELQFFIDEKVPQVKFVDRTFNCNHEHAMEIWQYIKEADQGITNFHFEVSADLLRQEEIELLNSMRPGLVQLEIGVQSTNEQTITEIRRTMDLNRLKETTCAIQKAENIHQHLDLIAGLPYEDIRIFQNSFDEIYALKPNQLQMGFLKVLKGSYMYENRQEYELVYKSTPQYEVMATKWLTYDDVIRLKRIEEMLEVYYNRGQFEVTMKIMEKAFESPFQLYDELGDYYEKKGLFLMSHNRNQRAQILMDFILEEGILEEEMIRESLTYDIYYRENAKSRPSFAREYQVPKEIRNRVEGKGKQRHIEAFTYHFPEKHIKSIGQLPEKQQEYYVVFDYEHRDPLDHQATVSVMEEE